MLLEAVDYMAHDAAESFTRSLRETGFGVLKNHPIDSSIVTDIYEHWTAFFASEEKYDFVYNVTTQDGFYPMEKAETAKNFAQQDIKEYFHYYPWGQCPENLKGELQHYYDLAHQLAAQLLSWIEACSPPDGSVNYAEPLSGMIRDSDITLLRILHYPPLTGAEDDGAVRAAAHEDINLLTILPAASVTGLEVLSSEGDWIEVPCDFDTLIVNAGDMLQEASGGYFRSTKHRVVNPVGEARNVGRMSLPLFLHPRPEVVLSERYTAGSYLDERLRELGVV